MAKKKRASVYFDRELMIFVGLDDVLKKHLRDTFANINIEFELNKMGLWLCSTKGMRRKGDMGFILHWLRNASPSPLINYESYSLPEPDSNLDCLLNDYLEGLWKNREHILEFNTIRKSK